MVFLSRKAPFWFRAAPRHGRSVPRERHEMPRHEGRAAGIRTRDLWSPGPSVESRPECRSSRQGLGAVPRGCGSGSAPTQSSACWPHTGHLIPSGSRRLATSAEAMRPCARHTWWYSTVSPSNSPPHCLRPGSQKGATLAAARRSTWSGCRAAFQFPPRNLRASFLELRLPATRPPDPTVGGLR
jgi:hypothetical protein